MRITKVPFRKVANAKSSWSIEFSDEEQQVHLFISSFSECFVTLYGDNGFGQEKVFPLWSGTKLDQTFLIPAEVQTAVIHTEDDDAIIAYSYEITETRRRGAADPVPVRAIVPIDDNSIDRRIRRQIEALAAQHGLQTQATGHKYSDEDDEYGPGYQYDEEVDNELLERATERVIADLRKRGKLPPADADPEDGTGRNTDSKGGSRDGDSSAGDDPKQSGTGNDD